MKNKVHAVLRNLKTLIRLQLSTPSACWLVFALVSSFCSHTDAETVSILLSSNASVRVEFGVEQVSRAISEAGLVRLTENTNGTDHPDHWVIVGHPDLQTVKTLVTKGLLRIDPNRLEKEGYIIGSWGHSEVVLVLKWCRMISGLLYGCMELAKRIRQSHKLPDDFQLIDSPAMKLRGTCVAMQKTFILPGRRVYEYPYTPELFPWF